MLCRSCLITTIAISLIPHFVLAQKEKSEDRSESKSFQKARAIPSEVEKADEEVTKVIERSEGYFRLGKQFPEANKRDKAREVFDKAVDTILESGLDVRASFRLYTYYVELTEKIYREEVPLRGFTNQPFSELNSPNSRPPQSAPSTALPQIGFRQQKFEPKPNDKLANTVLPSKPRETALVGSKPQQFPNGKVPIVMSWFQENLHNPYSLRIVRWSQLEKTIIGGQPYWVVSVRFRSRNAFNAYVLSDYKFFIQRNKITFKTSN
jgi:hypothetical protein